MKPDEVADGGEDGIASQVTVTAVDGLEVVEIEEDQGERPSAAEASPDLEGEKVLEVLARQGSRQAVGHDGPAQLPLGLLAAELDLFLVADIEERPRQAQRPPPLVAREDLPSHEDPDRSPVGPETAFAGKGSGKPLEMLVESPVEGGNILRMKATAPVVKRHFPLFVGGGRHSLEAAMKPVGGHIPVPDPLGGPLQGLEETFLLAEKGLLPLLMVREVDDDADDAPKPPLSVPVGTADDEGIAGSAQIVLTGHLAGPALGPAVFPLLLPGSEPVDHLLHIGRGEFLRLLSDERPLVAAHEIGEGLVDVKVTFLLVAVEDGQGEEIDEPLEETALIENRRLGPPPAQKMKGKEREPSQKDKKEREDVGVAAIERLSVADDETSPWQVLLGEAETGQSVAVEKIDLGAGPADGDRRDRISPQDFQRRLGGESALSGGKDDATADGRPRFDEERPGGVQGEIGPPSADLPRHVLRAVEPALAVDGEGEIEEDRRLGEGHDRLAQLVEGEAHEGNPVGPPGEAGLDVAEAVQGPAADVAEVADDGDVVPVGVEIESEVDRPLQVVVADGAGEIGRRLVKEISGMGDAAEDDGNVGKEVAPAPQGETEGLVAAGDDEVDAAVAIAGTHQIGEGAAPEKPGVSPGVEVVDGEERVRPGGFQRLGNDVGDPVDPGVPLVIGVKQKDLIVGQGRKREQHEKEDDEDLEAFGDPACSSHELPTPL